MSAWKGRAWQALGGSRANPATVADPPPLAEKPTLRPQRILLVNQYYWPDRASTAQHLTDLAESLAVAGHDVHVVCSRGGSRPGEPRRPRRESHNGVTIHRVGATALGRGSTLRRMTDYLSFFAGGGLTSLRLPRFDVVVTLTTPPLVGLVGTVVRRLRGSKHVSWSMDLHPDASLALGRMDGRNPAVRLLKWLGDRSYREADRVVALGPYMADRLRSKGVAESSLAIIPVWSRSDEIGPAPREGNAVRESLDLGRRFVAMYSGNLGLAHTFDAFLGAAQATAGRDDIVWLFVGGGPRRAEVEAAVATGELPNVRLVDSVPRESLSDLLTVADVHLVSMRPEMTGIVVPSKLYGAMASGRPTIFVGPAHCEAADLVRDAGCGFAIREQDAAGVAAAVELMAADPEAAQRLGDAGRAAFLERYDRGACCDDWVRLVEGLTAPSGAESLAVHRPLSPVVASRAMGAGRVRLPGRSGSAARAEVGS
jgi:glycosyltransferase involved in cell wall biosynthesis